MATKPTIPNSDPDKTLVDWRKAIHTGNSGWKPNPGASGRPQTTHYEGGLPQFPRDGQFSSTTGGGSHHLANPIGGSPGGRVGGFGIGRSN